MEFSEDFFRNLVDQFSDGVYFVDPTRKILYWNQGAEKITGYDRDEVLGSYCPDNILQHVDATGQMLCLVGCPLTRALRDGVTHEEEIFLRHKDGHRVPILSRAIPVRNEQGMIVGAIEIFSDNSRQYDALSKARILEAQAILDALTGLGNRRYCDQRLEELLREQKRKKKVFGVLLFDIDYFKNINDTYGHDVGDEILRMVGKTLSGNMRGFDFLGRWGGEEFLALVTEADAEILYFVAERCRVLVEKSSLQVGAKKVSVTISVGATLSNALDDEVSILRRVDQLMYQSKENGRNRVTLDRV